MDSLPHRPYLTHFYLLREEAIKVYLSEEKILYALHCVMNQIRRVILRNAMSSDCQTNVQ